MTVALGSGTLHFVDISNIVEALIYTEGKRHLIPGMEFEDIAQEIRLECFRAMSNYDSSRIGPTPFKFFQICVRNRLYNMRRGVYVPNNPPCVRCEFWDKKNKTCKIDEVGCQEIIDYRKGMAIKAALKSPKSLPENKNSDNSSIYNYDILDARSGFEIEAKILDEDIRAILPKKVLSEYIKLISGHGNEVSLKNKKKIRSLVKNLITNA